MENRMRWPGPNSHIKCFTLTNRAVKACNEMGLHHVWPLKVYGSSSTINYHNYGPPAMFESVGALPGLGQCARRGLRARQVHCEHQPLDRCREPTYEAVERGQLRPNCGSNLIAMASTLVAMANLLAIQTQVSPCFSLHITSQHIILLTSHTWHAMRVYTRLRIPCPSMSDVQVEIQVDSIGALTGLDEDAFSQHHALRQKRLQTVLTNDKGQLVELSRPCCSTSHSECDAHSRCCLDRRMSSAPRYPFVSNLFNRRCSVKVQGLSLRMEHSG